MPTNKVVTNTKDFLTLFQLGMDNFYHRDSISREKA